MRGTGRDALSSAAVTSPEIGAPKRLGRRFAWIAEVFRAHVTEVPGRRDVERASRVVPKRVFGGGARDPPRATDRRAPVRYPWTDRRTAMGDLLGTQAAASCRRHSGYPASLCPTSSGMRTRSRWRTRASRWS